MNEVLTIEEIEARYAPFWVLIGEPETDDHQHLLGGRVLFSSPEREPQARAGHRGDEELN